MTTNRARILENIETTFASIVEGGGPGYHLTVRTVKRHLRATTDVDPDADLPSLDFFPAKGGNPGPVYFPFGAIEEQLDVTVIGMVAVDISAEDGGDAEASTLLSELEEDARRALAVDPRRGGWAIETVKVDHGDTDEGRPNKAGIQDGIASAVWRFRCTYYPND